MSELEIPFALADQWDQMLKTKGHCATYWEIAQWGADQELEACCEWMKLEGHEYEHNVLFAARRPKPPSLKEQALEALRHAPGPDQPNPITLLTADEHALIRRALEQLDD